MIKILFPALLVVTALRMGTASAAVPTGILSNQGKLKPVVALANSSSEKVVKTFAGDADSGPVYEVQPGPEKVSAKVVALLGEEYDFPGINADTKVALRLGDFSFEGTLGEAGIRKLQATGNATFMLSMQVPLLDADGGAKLDAEGNELFSVLKLGTLFWAWSSASKTVTVTLAAVIPGGGLADAAGVTGIATAQFGGLGQQISQGGERRFANQPVGVSVKFGGSEGTRNAFVTGVTRTRLVKVPGAEAPHLTTSVVLAGGADTRGPQLAVRMPTKVSDVLGRVPVPIFATLLDRPAPSGYSTPDELGWEVPEVGVYVNQIPGEGVEPDLALAYRDARGNALAEGAPFLSPKGAGSLAGQVTLAGGTQTLRFVAVDSEGNTATVVKNIVISNVPQSFIQVNGGTLPDSSPLGAVSVDPFHIGTYEVRWGEFQAVRTWAAANGYDIGTAGAGVGANYPVTDVNWYTALKWCNARSEMEGRVPVYWVGGAVYRTENQVPTVNATANGYRLPSEKEWEWAARGGGQTNGYTFSGGNDWNAVGWFAGNSGRTIHVVGTKRANELGTYDMTGNVFEWCFDDYDGSGAYRVFRGGSWNSSEHFWVGFRNVLLVPTLSSGPIVSNNYIGFRLALSLVP